ncbi:MAG: DUF58 domain-containing protein [Saccharofermentanales bacterium]
MIAKLRSIFKSFMNDENIRTSIALNRIIYFSIFIASFVYVYLVGGFVPYLLFELIIALPVISLLYTLFAVSLIRISQKLSKPEVIKNEDIVFSFNLSKKRFIYIPFVRINFNFEKIAFSNCNRPQFVSLSPFKSNSNTYTINCKLTGIFDAGIKDIEIFDLLGIFRFTKKASKSLEVTVFPRFLTLEELNASQSAGFSKATSKKAIYTDPLSIDDIRKYAQGDSYRSIHWKLSAKKNELLVKQNEKTSDNHALIIVDLYHADNDRDSMLVLRDQILEYTVSLLYYCLMNQFNITFIYFGTEGKVEINAKDIKDFALIYNNILKIDLTGDIKLPDIILRLIDEIPMKHNLIAISSNIDEQLESALGRAHDKGYNVYLYDSSIPIVSSYLLKTEEIMATLIF